MFEPLWATALATPMTPTADPHAPSLDLEKAKRYSSEKISLAFLSLGLTLAYLLAWVPFSRPAEAWCGRTFGDYGGTALGFAALLLAGRAFLGFPLAYYGGHLHEHRYGLSTQRPAGWLADWLKASLLGAAFSLAAVAGFYGAIWTCGALWWLVVLAGWLGVTLLLDVVFPVLILPLFVKLTPLDRPDLAERLGKLAAAAGFRLAGLYRAGFAARTNKANAFLMGLGPTRRIALADTLLDRYTPDEIEVVFAHELGHHVRKHVFLGLIASALAAFFVLELLDQEALKAWVLRPLGYRWIGNPAALPVVAIVLALVAFLGAPVANVFSRALEEQADRYALAVTRNPAAFVSLMEKLAAQNLTDPAPSPLVEAWFYSHPPMARRIAMARRWEAEESGGAAAG